MGIVNEPPPTVRAAISEQLSRPGGLALTLAGSALTLVTIFVLPSWRLPAQVFFAAIIVGTVSAWILAAALREALVRESNLQERLSAALTNSRYAPKVLQAMSDPSSETALMLLLEPNRLFGQSMLVSLYYEDERGFELLVGSGQVTNVQTNGLIQISVTNWDDAHPEIWRGVVGRDESMIDRLLVRPAPTKHPGSELSDLQVALLAFLNSQSESQEDV